MNNILVVCVGNICRSPLAEVMLAAALPGKTVWSAGLGALVGQGADPISIELAAERGLDLNAHRAQQISGPMCQRAEMILVMEQGHQAELERRYPLTRGRVFRLGQLGKFDIADPYRQGRAAFETASQDIARGVADWAPRIRLLS